MGLSPSEDVNRRLLRARDAMDRRFADPLDIASLAQIALMSPAHFIRSFRLTFGEPPHRYLQRRRVERAMALLRDSERSVTEVAFEVGFASLGTFSRTFKTVVGMSPSTYRLRSEPLHAPGCFVRTWTRPSSTRPSGPARPRSSSFGEAPRAVAP